MACCGKKNKSGKKKKCKCPKCFTCRPGMRRCWYCGIYLLPILWLIALIIFALALAYAISYTLGTEIDILKHILNWSLVACAFCLVLAIQITLAIVLFENKIKCFYYLFAILLILAFIFCIICFICITITYTSGGGGGKTGTSSPKPKPVGRSDYEDEEEEDRRKRQDQKPPTSPPTTTASPTKLPTSAPHEHPSYLSFMPLDALLTKALCAAILLALIVFILHICLYYTYMFQGEKEASDCREEMAESRGKVSNKSSNVSEEPEPKRNYHIYYFNL